MAIYPRFSRRVFAALLICVAAALAGCRGGRGGDTPTPVPTVPDPVLASVPPGTVIDFARAQELYHAGDDDGALVIYSAAAKNGTDQQKQDGLWAIARIQNERGDHNAAGRTVQAFRATNPPSERDRQALLLLGTAEFGGGDMNGAREALSEYVRLGGPASPYAQLYLAQIDAREDKLDSAVNRSSQALGAGLPAETSYQAQLLLADVQARAHSPQEAIAAYRAAADEAPTATKASEALWLLADVAQTAGDSQAASDALAGLIVNYPLTDRALEALSDPRVASNPSVAPTDRGTVLLNHKHNDEATAAFQAIVDAGGAGVPLAQYDLGILSERAADWQSAIAHYQSAITVLAPGSDDSLRAQASWDLGTVYERIGLVSDAIDAYAAVADFSATAKRAPEGLFRAGYLAHNLGRIDDAIVYWLRYRDVATVAEDRARADYWLAEASSQAGDPDSAATYLSASAADDQLDYYGMRAAARIGRHTSFPDAIGVEPVTPDWLRYETWLTGWAGAEDVPATDALFAGELWLRAVDLYEAGLTDRADDQWESLLADAEATPWLAYRLLRAIGDYDRPWITSPAAAKLLDHPDAPPEALQLEYPLEYWSLVENEAAANGFSPLLLLALVRQESLYDPAAVSSAEAMGLTQVIPSTAEGIAEELGITDFKTTDLLQAATSLQFGAHYLGSTLSGFGGVLPPTVAAYNAGAGAAGGWWEVAGGDPDLFLETIDFPETRLFVEVVLENYARYLYAYGVITAPSLPLP